MHLEISKNEHPFKLQVKVKLWSIHYAIPDSALFAAQMVVNIVKFVAVGTDHLAAVATLFGGTMLGNLLLTGL